MPELIGLNLPGGYGETAMGGEQPFLNSVRFERRFERSREPKSRNSNSPSSRYGFSTSSKPTRTERHYGSSDPEPPANPSIRHRQTIFPSDLQLSAQLARLAVRP